MWITFIIAAIAIVLLMLGLSITLLRKGRNLQSDVGDNDDMKRLGVKCTIEQMGGNSCSSGSTCGTDGTQSTCATCADNSQCAINEGDVKK